MLPRLMALESIESGAESVAERTGVAAPARMHGLHVLPQPRPVGRNVLASQTLPLSPLVFLHVSFNLRWPVS